MTATIRAILVDPTARTVSEIQVPTVLSNPFEEEGGPYPCQRTLRRLMDGATSDTIQLTEAIRIFVNIDWAFRRDREDTATDFWRWTAFDFVVGGKAVTTGFDGATYSATDLALTIEEAQALVRFGDDEGLPHDSQRRLRTAAILPFAGAPA